jgi:hypothetical protein
MKTIHVVAAAACMAHSAAAFGMAPSSTLPMAGRNHRSAAAAVRMQQETAVAKESKSDGSEGEGVTEVKAAVDNKIGVAVRTRPNVQANQEVNFYARTAVRMGALKETSPLMTSTMPGNKVGPAAALLLCRQRPHPPRAQPHTSDVATRTPHALGLGDAFVS